MYYTDEEIKTILTNDSYDLILSGGDYENGQMEQIDATARAAARGIQSLLVQLINKKLITLDEAAKILQNAKMSL